MGVRDIPYDFVNFFVLGDMFVTLSSKHCIQMSELLSVRGKPSGIDNRVWVHLRSYVSLLPPGCWFGSEFTVYN